MARYFKFPRRYFTSLNSRYVTSLVNISDKFENRNLTLLPVQYWGRENVLFFLTALSHKSLLICLFQSVATNASTLIHISPSYDSTKFGIGGRKQIIIQI